MTRRNLEITSTFAAQRASTVLGVVAAGAGAAILPSMTHRKRMYPRLRLIPLVDPVIERELAVMKPRGTTLSPAAQALYAMLSDAFRNIDYGPVRRTSS